VNPDEENARIRIVSPNNDKPKVRRKVTTGTGQQATAVSTGRSHTVAAGETLYRISRKYGVSVDAILSANPGVKASSLGIGKPLRIP
jgi:LysM repeat protein